MYDLNKIKPVPSGFFDWIDCELTPEPIFYKNYRGTSDLRCGRCGEASTIYLEDDFEMDFEIPAKKPKRHDDAVCPLCGHRSYYEIGTVTAAHTHFEHFLLVQQDTDKNLVCRVFEVKHKWQKGTEASREPYEVERYVCMPGRMIKIKKDWYYGKNGWNRQLSEKKAGRMTWTYELKTYFGNGDGYNLEEEIKTSSLPYFDSSVYSGAFNRCYGDSYLNYGVGFMMALTLFARAPYTESFCKMGWDYIVWNLLAKDGADKSINRLGKTLRSQLKLKKASSVKRFRSLMACSETEWRRCLTVLQGLERAKIEITDEEFDCLMDIMCTSEELGTMLKLMTVRQLINRVNEYKDKEKFHTLREAFIEYHDYLNIRRSLGYDMTRETYIHPKALRSTHSELILEQRAREDESKRAEKERMYSKMQEVFEKLTKIYNWEFKDYVIRPARAATELIDESKALHHCVGSSDTYMKRHASGESYILFLRKKKTPDVPFTTIEISGKGQEPRILQWYEAYDRKPDEKVLQPIIDKYVKHVSAVLKNKRKGKAS